MKLPALVILSLVAGLAAPQARAQARFEGSYTLSMAGIPVGKLTWSTQFSASDYVAKTGGHASGLLSLLVSGEGRATVRGLLREGRAQPSSFDSAVDRVDEKTAVHITFEAGRVRDLKVEEPAPESDRVPIQDAHKIDVVDPFSALLIPAGDADPLAPAACARVLAIFDGRRRYDIALSFRRIDKALPEKGYQGPALVCGIKFTPMSGHRRSSPLVKFLSEERDIEAWFVPIKGTKLLAPVRMSVASAIGNLVLRADTFEIGEAALPAR
jgi:hypothetical protein